ncbi:helix-turn-helix domain-containing protein [Atrimonas thermophila]|uniref:helix-turn-helix domain-containing protein n=1 Tax=Atrimonas thermophila TaxID=3064161 RepID=UPI00399D192A
MLTKGRLKALQCGLGCKVLARMLGISETYVSSVLSGRVRPSQNVLKRLAEVLELPEEELQGPVEGPAASGQRS